MKNNHKRVKRILIILIFISISFILICNFTGYNIVIPISGDKKTYLNAPAKLGSKIAIFSNFNFSEGDWKAYIVIARDDFSDLDSAIPQRSCLKTTDRRLLQEMKKSWRFKITEGDAGTVASDLYLFKNGKLVYKSGIILSKNYQRLQNEEFGELVPVNQNAIISACRQFKEVRWPVVLL